MHGSWQCSWPLLLGWAAGTNGSNAPGNQKEKRIKRRREGKRCVLLHCTPGSRALDGRGKVVCVAAAYVLKRSFSFLSFLPLLFFVLPFLFFSFNLLLFLLFALPFRPPIPPPFFTQVGPPPAVGMACHDFLATGLGSASAGLLLLLLAFHSPGLVSSSPNC